ncbi:unnamed protein product [Ectocarpus sp. 12 AP-2014]
MKHGRPDLRAAVVGVVLQAPVSDREYLETLPSTEGFVEEARVRGGGGELMPVAADQAPITAARFLSLATKEGDDDMFSADLTADERHGRLGHMASVPTAAFLSGADQFVPPGGGRSPPEVLAETLRAAMVSSSSSSSPSSSPPGTACSAASSGRAEPGDGTRGGASTTASTPAAKKTVAFVIDDADHSLSTPAHAQEFISKVEVFAAGLG